MRAGRGQTIIDVAAQSCGCAEAAWEIAVRSGLNLTDTPGATDLAIPTDEGDPDTAAAMAASDAKPATDGVPVRDRRVPIGQFEIGIDIIR